MTQPSEYQVGPYDVDHVLLTWGGKLPGNETWSCSLRLAQQDSVGGVEVPPNAEITSWMNGSAKDAVLAYHTRPDSHIGANATLQYIKMNRINTEGLYMDQGTNEHVFTDTPGGGPYGTVLPNQCALAISLTTGFSRGPAHRGRFFLPVPDVNIDTSTGAMNPNDAEEIVGSSKIFLEAIADIPGLDSPVSLTPCVMSRKAGAPNHRPITGVEVGRVIDTQRRRRKSLVEGYEQRVALDLGAN